VSFLVQCSVPGFAENLSNSVSKGIIAEVGNTEDSLCGNEPYVRFVKPNKSFN